ncbi:MAG: cyclic 2,3-diphosphoglycerate synthase [Planctomycetota bacterium]|jgi:predicted GTPase
MDSVTGKRLRTIIVGAAGRDFHDFNVHWNDPRFDVVAFTAAQIPGIDDRIYPPELCGERYPDGIPMEPEDKLADLIKQHEVDQVAMAYSDIPYAKVMRIAAIANAAGATFCTLGARQTMLPCNKPVIAICAVRTGCGKSQTARVVCSILKESGLRVAAIRHPMPYGELREQVCQRFASLEDLIKHKCTIEEREEYEPHIRAGNIVFAGVDYRQIVSAAEKECDVIVWDGGNNDLPFVVPDMHIVVADAHRPGHELAYYPGETNARMADLLIINKIDSADTESVRHVEDNLRKINPKARLIRARSPVTVDDADAIRGKRVLIVEDGPTLTHGEMSYGAGAIAARANDAGEFVDPRPFAVGSIKDTFATYPHLNQVLPAMGYGKRQISELEKTINAADCDLVLVATPIDLSAIIQADHPMLRVRYDLDDQAARAVRSAIESCIHLPALTG